MTTKTFPEQRAESRATSMTAEAASTWHGLAGQWLRTSPAQDREALARRRAAVQRWRGLPPETKPCLESCRP